MTLKTSFKKVVSLFLTHLFLVSMFPFFPLSVHALDLPSTGSATGDWAVSQAVQQALAPVEKAVLYRFSSDSAEVDTALAIMTAEVGFCNALAQDVWASSVGFDNFTISGTSFQVLSGVSRVTHSDGTVDLYSSTITMSNTSICARSGEGVYILWRPDVGYPASLLLHTGYVQFHFTSPPSVWNSHSGYFDTVSPSSTKSGWGDCVLYWSNSTIPTLTPTSYMSVNNSGGALSSFTMNSFLRTTQSAPLPVDTSSDDVPTIMAAYKSALASQLGVTVEDVDEVWTLPDEIPENPSEPDGSGCCCEPFELPSEWVQSDVVELETDHYTIPYTDLVRNPYDYLLYGVTAPPPPVTPADDAKKAAQTKTATKATRSGDPIQDLQNTDYEMYEALTDYSALLTDILDRSGVLPYWAILMAAGALFLII